jgi:acyl-CoA dehydrogenase
MSIKGWTDAHGLDRLYEEEQVSAAPTDCLRGRVSSIAREVARSFADAVDAEARFPCEVFAALRAARVLSAGVPIERGGGGVRLPELGEICSTLSSHCGSSGLVLAMHFIQVACLCRHSHGSQFLQNYVAEIAERQLLLASVVSEPGTGGDARRSVCALEQQGTQISLTKTATTASYAQHADGYLVTARKHAEADPGNQVFVLFRRDQTTLEQTGTWNTLGMRGTCGPSLRFVAHGGRDQVFLDSYARLSARSVVPIAHVLWASVWEGIAAAAVARAVTFARGGVGSSTSNDRRLAPLVAGARALRLMWRHFAERIEATPAIPCDFTEPEFFDWVFDLNALKVESSTRAQRLVHDSLQILGVAGFRNDSPYSVGRMYRDVLSASLMVANERLVSINSHLAVTGLNCSV